VSDNKVVTPRDYFHLMGEAMGYTPEATARESKAMGISRLVGSIPNHLVPGSSKVYLIYGAQKDSLPRNCPWCGGEVDRPMYDPKDPNPQPLPESIKCTNRYPGKGKTWVTCNKDIFTRRAQPGKIVHDSVPDRIELFIRSTDEKVRAAAELAAALGRDGPVTAELEEGAETFRARFSARTGTFDERAVKQLQSLARKAGASAEVKLIMDALGKGEQVVIASRENRRICGFRKHARKYIIGSPKKSSLKALPEPVEFSGQAFRGLMTVPALEANALNTYIHVGRPKPVTITGVEPDAEEAELLPFEED
jgi:hypothetical protein